MQLREVPISINKYKAPQATGFSFGGGFGSLAPLASITTSTTSFGFGTTGSASNMTFGAPPSANFDFFSPPVKGSSGFFGFSAQSVNSQPPPSQHDKLVSIVLLQSADGSWSLTPQLSSQLGTSEAFLIQLASTFSVSNKLRFWATCLGTKIQLLIATALAYLEENFQSNKDEWMLVASKAHKYLSKEQMGPTDQWINCGKQALKQIQGKI